MRASVTASDGADLEKGVEITPKCNFLHTLWSQVDVYLNGLLVTQFNNNYPYRAYIENLLSFGQEAKNCQLSALLWQLCYLALKLLIVTDFIWQHGGVILCLDLIKHMARC